MFVKQPVIYKPVGHERESMASKGAKTRERILTESKEIILKRGFSGTSIEDILQATGLTKGAFFYHFKSKHELAHALIERTWQNDLELFRGFAARARELSDDPLQAALIFVKLFEEVLEANRHDPIACIFASYLYECEHFSDETRAFIEQGLMEWKQVYEDMFAPIYETRQPRMDVPAAELAEMLASIIEGGFILSRSQGDGGASVRSSRQFRQYLQLLFSE